MFQRVYRHTVSSEPVRRMLPDFLSRPKNHSQIIGEELVLFARVPYTLLTFNYITVRYVHNLSRW
jgi:hypothetical protein